MLDTLIYVFSFILALGILVTVHEFGHFWVARKLGVKVLRFSVGFGRPIWVKKAGQDQTEYVLSAIPLGGYVKMLDEREGEVSEQERHRAFNNKSVWSRMAIIVAGPGFNFLFAILALWIMFLSGIPGVRAIVGEVKSGTIAEQSGFQAGDQIISIGGDKANTWEAVRLELFDAALDREPVKVVVRDQDDNQVIRILDLTQFGDPVEAKDLVGQIGFERWSPPPVLGEVKTGGPADQAGLKAGDRIVSANGQELHRWLDWVRYVRQNPGKEIKVEYERSGTRGSTTLHIGEKEIEGNVIGRVQVAMPQEYLDKLFLKQEYSIGMAFVAGLVKTWDMSVLMLRVLGRMVIGEASIKNISGPITIAQYAGESASLGLLPFLSFLAIVSVSLGVLNLLPIPVLDGGHLFYYLIELVKGSPLSERVQMVFQQVGIFLLVALMILAFYNDLERLFG